MISRNPSRTLIPRNSAVMIPSSSNATHRRRAQLLLAPPLMRLVMLFVMLVAGIAAVFIGAGQVRAEDIIGEVALLQGLDKVTARISTFRAPIDTVVRFGTLEIVARACHKRPPEEPPESAAFLHIRDVKPGEIPETLFQGWMFASSPALSALEHPVYDVWVVDCLSKGMSVPEISG